MKRTTGAAVAILTAGYFLVAVPAMSKAMSKLPAETKSGPISYVSGGIGHREAAVFRQAEMKYPLSLQFIQRAKPRDEYLSDVKVTIEGRAIEGHTSGSAFQATSAGPFLLAKLPDGEYMVRAEKNGATKVRHVTIAEHKPEHIVFAW